MKKYLIIYYGDVPESVEGFHKDCKRSCKGALHVKPGRQMTVTEDELNHLKGSDSYKHMTDKLRVIGEKKDPERKPEKKGESKKDEPTANKDEGTKKTKKKVTKKTK